jgi:hypothetical protein
MSLPGPGGLRGQPEDLRRDRQRNGEQPQHRNVTERGDTALEAGDLGSRIAGAPAKLGERQSFGLSGAAHDRPGLADSRGEPH